MFGAVLLWEAIVPKVQSVRFYIKKVWCDEDDNGWRAHLLVNEFDLFCVAIADNNFSPAGRLQTGRSALRYWRDVKSAYLNCDVYDEPLRIHIPRNG